MSCTRRPCTLDFIAHTLCCADAALYLYSHIHMQKGLCAAMMFILGASHNSRDAPQGSVILGNRKRGVTFHRGRQAAARPAKLERLRKSQVLMTRIFARHKAGRERHLARLPSALLPCQSGLHAGLASGPKGQEITLHQAQTIPREQGCGRRGVRHMTCCPTFMRACRMPSPTLTHALRLNSRCS